MLSSTTSGASLRLCSTFLLLFVFGWEVNASPAGSAYTVTDLETLGGTGSYAYGVNSSGQTAGYSTLSGDSTVQAFRYGAALNGLGTLSGFTSSTGRGVNDFGQVVGFAHDLGGTTTEAFRTAPNASINPATDGLGTLGGNSSAAYGINSSGAVVGASQITPSTSQQHAFIYSGTTMTDLHTLGGTNSVAYGINDSGQIVGWSHITGDSVTHSFIWQGGTMTDLALPGEVESEAYAINSAGHIVGAIRTSAANVWQGYLRNGSTTVDMGVLSGGVSTFAYAINDADIAVGYMNTTGGPDSAVRFSNSTLVNLNDLIDPSTGWILNRAYGINGSGQIVGDGTIGDEPHAFLLTPVPEPSFVSLPGCAVLLVRRTRRCCPARIGPTDGR